MCCYLPDPSPGRVFAACRGLLLSEQNHTIPPSGSAFYFVSQDCVGVQTSYETVLRDASVFTGIKWYTMIADEAHRFKSVSGQTRSVITRMSVIWKLLLTGGLFLPFCPQVSCGVFAPDQALKPI